jgi:hypothetical protein
MENKETEINNLFKKNFREDEIGAIESAEKYLQKTGWVKGKHV